MIGKYLLVSASMVMLIAGCGSRAKNGKNASTIPSIKKVYSDDFLIGTALNGQQVSESETTEAALIPYQFAAFTPENLMKSEELLTAWNQYDFSKADQMVAYAQKHHLLLNGHTLIWHSQLPAFVNKMQSKDSLREFFTNHINTVAGRYDGKVYSWDVVNEALEEDGSLRKSVFLNKLGEDFIVEAFRLAQKASPKSLLYYNDFNIEQPKKRAGAIALIKKIQAAGVRIDGVGIQGHWAAGKVPMKDIEQSIIDFAALGVKVMFTELDLGVLPNPWDGNTADVSQTAAYDARMNPYAAGLPDSIEQKLTNSYVDLFKLFLKHKDKVSRVTFWGVNDTQSWLNDWPIKGRTNYPLLFDRQFKPKPAFYEVIGLLKNGKADTANK